MQDGWTPLILAAYKGHTECARLLLLAGADKEAKDKVRSLPKCFTCVHACIYVCVWCVWLWCGLGVGMVCAGVWVCGCGGMGGGVGG